MDSDLTKEKIVAVVQARMTSSRLPGKPMLLVGTKPSIFYVLSRVEAAKAVDEVILATSDEPEDSDLARIVEDAGYLTFRGSLHDVLVRTFAAATKGGARHVVRIPGDKLLVDPKEVSRVVREHLKTSNDYTANFSTGHPITRLVPLGLEVEVFKLASLEWAISAKIIRSEDREHVTSVFYNNPELFKLGYSWSPVLRPFSQLRVNLDDERDLSVIRAIHRSVGLQVSSKVCLEWLKNNPKISEMNQDVLQKPLPARVAPEESHSTETFNARKEC